MISQDIKRRLKLVSADWVILGVEADDGRLAQQLIVLALGEHFSQPLVGLERASDQCRLLIIHFVQKKKPGVAIVRAWV